jgi:hypothetical protein
LRRTVPTAYAAVVSFAVTVVVVAVVFFFEAAEERVFATLLTMPCLPPPVVVVVVVVVIIVVFFARGFADGLVDFEMIVVVLLVSEELLAARVRVEDCVVKFDADFLPRSVLLVAEVVVGCMRRLAGRPAALLAGLDGRPRVVGGGMVLYSAALKGEAAAARRRGSVSCLGGTGGATFAVERTGDWEYVLEFDDLGERTWTVFPRLLAVLARLLEDWVAAEEEEAVVKPWASPGFRRFCTGR